MNTKTIIIITLVSMTIWYLINKSRKTAERTLSTQLSDDDVKANGKLRK